MAFTLSPLSLYSVPFKINPIKLTPRYRTCIRLLLTKHFLWVLFLQLVSSVPTAHGSSRTEDDFRPSHRLLDIADMTLQSTQFQGAAATRNMTDLGSDKYDWRRRLRWLLPWKQFILCKFLLHNFYYVTSICIWSSVLLNVLCSFILLLPDGK